MATIKSFTSLEQAKKLAEILPLESADMYWYLATKDNHKARFNEGYNEYGDFELPCWSFTALLRVIPKKIKNVNVLRIDIDEKDFSIWYDKVGYGVNTELPDITMECPIDACVAMIEKLHELNLL